MTLDQIQKSIREQIVDAIVALLAIDGVEVHRERTRPIEDEKLPALLLYFEDEEPAPIGSDRRAPFVERALQVIVEARAEVIGGQSPDQALDPLLSWTAQRLLQNETIGGLANGVTEGRTSWSSKESGTTLASATSIYTIRYRTSRLDPTSRT